MKVLLLTQYFTPEPIEKFADLARSLVEHGHEVEVLTSFPCYPKGKIYPGFNQRLIQVEEREGYRVLRVPQRPNHSKSIIGRALYYFSFAFSAATIGLAKITKPDVVLVYQSALPTGFAAWLISRVRRVPYVLDVADLWPESIASSGMLTNVWVLNVIRHCANFVYRGAAKISVITEGYRDNLVQHGVPADKIEVIHYWMPEGKYDAVASDETCAQRYQMTGRFNVVYAGAMGPCQDLEAVLEAAALLNLLPDTQFLLIGDGVCSDALQAKARSLKIDNVRFLGRLPSDEVARINSCADLLLVHLKPDEMSKVSIPSKTFACMASGRPILMAVEGEAGRLVQKHGCGIAVTPSDPTKLANAIKEFRLLPRDLQQQMGEAGRKAYAENYSSRIQVSKMETLLKRVAAKVTRKVDNRGFYLRRGKRLFDIALLIPALIVCLPIMAVVALLVRVKLGEPVLFRQTRPGLHGQHFKLVKFRTMLEEYDANGNPLPDEKRLRRFGKFLRSTSLDELPELWNILRGELSFVGPRPLLREYLALYSTEQARRHEVHPGLTGWVQINGRNDMSWDSKLAHDVWYVENISFWLDVKILCRTIGCVLQQRGISAKEHVTMPPFLGNQSSETQKAA